MHKFFGISASLSCDARPYHTYHESGAGKRLALDLSNAALQVSINAKELDAEARTIRQIADDLPD